MRGFFALRAAAREAATRLPGRGVVSSSSAFRTGVRDGVSFLVGVRAVRVGVALALGVFLAPLGVGAAMGGSFSVPLAVPRRPYVIGALRAEPRRGVPFDSSSPLGELLGIGSSAMVLCWVVCATTNLGEVDLSFRRVQAPLFRHH